MSKLIAYYVSFQLICNTVLSDMPICSTADVKTILEGCDHLTGLNVTTIGGTSINDHNCDVLLPKQIFLDEPTYRFELADSKKFYTLLMIDPDAPPQLDGEFYIHLIKSNIPGLAMNNMDVKSNYGVDFRAYKPPSPSRGSGAHRYINLLYEQADGNNFLPNLPSFRTRFKLHNWLHGKNLCGPVAATQFRVLF